MSTTMTALAPISETTRAPRLAVAPLPPLLGAWEELALLSERWRSLAQMLQIQVTTVISKSSPIP